MPGEVMNVMVNLMMDGRELGIPASNFKYDKLSREHELLKEKLDKTLKELAQEKETKKSKPSAAADDSKNEELANRKLIAEYFNCFFFSQYVIPISSYY